MNLSMKRLHSSLAVAILLLVPGVVAPAAEDAGLSAAKGSASSGFTDAAEFGFSPDATGLENTLALQRAVDRGGTITVSRPGTYLIGGTVYLGSHTSLIFGNGVRLKKVAEKEPFSHVLLNKGALTKTWDRDITVTGLHIVVNGVDVNKWQVYGLRGQIAFFYVQDLRIERFRCDDLGKAQFCIHVCTFEDVLINDVIIKGSKDGVHLGRGKRFKISNGVFQTGDDAIALNAHDYATSNPELGWIEDGVVENCHDLADPTRKVGFFCRILAGAWIDWKPGMEVQHSDTVVSQGRLYRVQAKADGTVYKSLTQPTHEQGAQVLDGINWGVVQDDVTYTAGVRNVTFRDIFLGQPRVSFSVHFDFGVWSRSYYPGAPIPKQEQLLFDNVRVLHDEPADFLSIATPMDVVSIVNSSFRRSGIVFRGNEAMTNYLPTKINMAGCVFNHPGEMALVANQVPGKQITLKTTGSIEASEEFSAKVKAGAGSIDVESDLRGLRQP